MSFLENAPSNVNVWLDLIAEQANKMNEAERVRHISGWTVTLLQAVQSAKEDYKNRIELPQEAKKAAIKAIDERGAAGLAMIKRMFEPGKAAVTLRPKKIETEMQKNTYELQAGRAWARVKTKLDAGIDFQEIIQDADRVELRVLREELPAYMKATHTTPGMPHPYEKIAPEMIKAAEYNLMTPEEKAVQDNIAVFDTGVYQAGLALSYAESYLNGETQSVTIPLWNKGETEYVGPKQPVYGKGPQ